MRVIISILLLILLFNSSKSFAYEPKAGNITATLGALTTRTIFDGSTSGADTGYLGGFGLIAVGDVSGVGSLELSAFYTKKEFVRDRDAMFLVTRSQVAQVNMGYRWWLTSYLSASLTFYSAYSFGSPEIVHNDFPDGEGVTTSADDTTEYGFDISSQYEMWSSGRYAVVLDGRYSYSVTAKQNEYANSYAFLVGVRYFIQEKAPKKTRTPNF
jgi:hypothetical protein